jgi:hypothetical protein
MEIIHFILGYLAYFMLKRQLRYSVNSFAAFLRLGAEKKTITYVRGNLEISLRELSNGVRRNLRSEFRHILQFCPYLLDGML